MAITNLADSDELNSIIKRSLIGLRSNENIEIITKKSTVNVSNTITSLHNAFNQIYAYTVNVKNIHTSEEKRLKNIKKEVTMESRSIPASLAGSSSIDVGNLPDIFKQLTSSIQDLTKNLDNLNVSGTSGSASGIDIDIDRKRRAGGRASGRSGGRGISVRGLGMAGRGLGGIGVLFDVGGRVSEGESAGQIAAGVGGGIAGGVVGAKAGAVTGGAIGALFGGVGAAPGAAIGGVIGGIGGYLGGGFLGDRAYKATTNRNATRPLETAAANVTRRGNMLERATPIGSTSPSSRFADYMNQSIANMSLWAMAAARFAPLASIPGAIGDFFNAGAEGAGSSQNAETAISYFMSQGWTRAQAVGIVGNLQGESGANLNPNARAENDAGPGQHSYGIAQWNKERWAGLQSYALQSGRPWNNLQTQLEYVQRELTTTEQRVGRELSSAQDPAAAAIAMTRYERFRGYNLGLASPETRRRIANAHALFNGRGVVDRAAGSPARRLTGAFGERRTGHNHGGIDVPGTVGEPVASLQTGSVIFAGMGTPGSGYNNYGNVVHIRQENGYEALYAHLHSISPGVRRGALVQAAQIIGELGSTGRSSGPHLHFEIRRGNTRLDPTATYRSNPWIVGGREITALAPTLAPRRPAPSIAPGAFNNRPGDVLLNRYSTPNQSPAPSTSNFTGLDAWRSVQLDR